MGKDSVAASVYSYTFFFLQKSLFHTFDSENEANRILFTDNYLFADAMVRLIESAANDGPASKFNSICANGYSEYTGKSPCSYNIAKSFVIAKSFLEENASKKHEDWKWGNFLVKDYKNLPWSMTPLKPFFHRQIPAEGNVNTPNVARHANSKNANNFVFHSELAATYKHIM